MQMLRVFYQKFAIGDDPLLLHSPAQKATVLACLVLLKVKH